MNWAWFHMQPHTAKAQLYGEQPCLRPCLQYTRSPGTHNTAKDLTLLLRCPLGSIFQELVVRVESQGFAVDVTGFLVVHHCLQHFALHHVGLVVGMTAPHTHCQR